MIGSWRTQLRSYQEQTFTPQCALPGEQHWHHLSNQSRTRTGSHPVLVGSGQKSPGYLGGPDGGVSVTRRTNRPPETVSAEAGKRDTGGGSGQGRDYGEASRGPRTRDSRRPSLSASRHATADPKPAPAQGGSGSSGPASWASPPSSPGRDRCQHLPSAQRGRSLHSLKGLSVGRG